MIKHAFGDVDPMEIALGLTSAISGALGTAASRIATTVPNALKQVGVTTAHLNRAGSIGKALGGVGLIGLSSNRLFEMGKEALSPSTTRSRVDLLLHDNKQRVMVKRRYGRVDFPGGGIEKGQGVSAAAKREALEEVGYDAHKVRDIGVSPITTAWWPGAAPRKNRAGAVYTGLKNYVRAANIGERNLELYNTEGDALRGAKLVPISQVKKWLTREVRGATDASHALHKLEAVMALEKQL